MTPAGTARVNYEIENIELLFLKINRLFEYIVYALKPFLMLM